MAKAAAGFPMESMLLAVVDERSSGVVVIARFLVEPSALSLGNVSSICPLGDNLMGTLVPLGGALSCEPVLVVGTMSSIEPAFGMVSFSQNEVMACWLLISFLRLPAEGALVASGSCGALFARMAGWLLMLASSFPVSGPPDKTVVMIV